ncbi:MAG: hypothetical protein PHP35_00060 [Candidatus Colwellbacteria bacterium]|nr:hypothetical protein [Candidatus Colwellbacteria bacterium]
MSEKKNQDFTAYLDELKKRAKSQRVHSKHQDIGLETAEILGDREHKSLYMKLAKTDGDIVLAMAKAVAENEKVKNKGAYFMALWHKYRGNENSNNKRQRKRNTPTDNA